MIGISSSGAIAIGLGVWLAGAFCVAVLVGRIIRRGRR